MPLILLVDFGKAIAKHASNIPPWRYGLIRSSSGYYTFTFVRVRQLLGGGDGKPDLKARVDHRLRRLSLDFGHRRQNPSVRHSSIQNLP